MDSKSVSQLWNNKQFLSLAKEFAATRQAALMELIAEQYFIPLARHVVGRLWLHPTLDRFIVAMDATVLCWMKFGNLDLNHRNPMSYFYRIIERYVWAQNRKAAKRSTRYISLDVDEEDD